MWNTYGGGLMRKQGNAARGPVAVCLLVVAIIEVASPASLASWPQEQAGANNVLRNGPGVINHPVGVIPSAAIHIPEGWPLDARGAITCLTCHESLESLSEQTPTRLREPPGAFADTGYICVACHDTSRAGDSPGIHWTVLRHAHIKPESDSEASWVGSLDGTSTRCLTCHDGVSAQDTLYGTGGSGGHASFSDKGRNHPIGVPFRKNRIKSGMKLRTESVLPATIRLPKGQVSCVSCHNLYNTKQKRLSVPIEGSALCFSCHDMD